MTLMFFESKDGKQVQQMMPIFHFGWLW